MQNSNLRNKKVLVTGGAGFIGSNLVTALLAHDNYVVCLDNFSTGSPDNLNEFFNNPNFELINGDIRDIDICRKACNKCEFVFHQAALGSVPRSIDDPKSTNDVNIGGFINILIAARDEKVKRFIYASSSSVYGDNQLLPKTENVIGTQLSPYAITKYVNELYAQNFSRLYGMNTIGLRYFNVFGPKQNANSYYASVIPKFITAILNNQNPVIYGDGEQTRDFTYVENVVKANFQAASVDIKNTHNQLYNIACENQISLNQLIDLVSEIVSEQINALQKIVPEYQKERTGDVRFSYASIEKAKRFLQYVPDYDVKEGLRKTVAWFIEQNS